MDEQERTTQKAQQVDILGTTYSQLHEEWLYITTTTNTIETILASTLHSIMPQLVY